MHTLSGCITSSSRDGFRWKRSQCLPGENMSHCEYAIRVTHKPGNGTAPGKSHLSRLDHATMNTPPIPDSIASIERPCPELWTFYIIKGLATLIAAPLTLLLLYFRYHTMKYRFDADGIHMGWGILMRHEIMLNYSRIQDIQLQSNFVERWLGLARIQIQTASGGADSDMTLEGITDCEAMRDFLYSRMRGVEQSHSQPAQAGDESLAAILTEIASELKGIRSALEREND